MNAELIVQAIGIAATGVQIASYQAARRETVIAWQAVGCALWVLHFTGLGAIAGAVFNILAGLRGVMAILGARWPALRRCLWLFLPAIWAVSAATYQGPLDLLPAVAVTFSTLAQISRKVLSLRLFMLAGGPLWLTYSILTGSWGGMINESSSIVSNLIGIFRHHVLKRPAQDGVSDDAVAPQQGKPSGI